MDCVAKDKGGEHGSSLKTGNRKNIFPLGEAQRTGTG